MQSSLLVSKWKDGVGMDGGLIDDGELQAFVAVVTRGSFSLAAADLGCSQSTISQRVARLEKRTGRRLISRTTRRFAITHDGEAMLLYARSILSISEEVRQRLVRPGMKGVLRIGIEDEFAMTRLPEMLGLFRLQHPDFALKFVTGRNEHLRDVLRAHDVDMVLGKSHRDNDPAAIWQEQLIWMAHPSLNLRSADPVPFVSYLRPSLTRSIAESALRTRRRTWVDVGECSNLLGLLAIARSGGGVMVIGRSFRRTILEEVPSEAGLPSLGTLSYVIEGKDGRELEVDSAAGAFQTILSAAAMQSATDVPIA